METALTGITTDHLEQVLVAGEATVARVRATQMRVIDELDRRQVALSDGSRTVAEWVAARLDLGPDTATRLVQTTRRLSDQADLTEELADGAVTFDRVVEESRLIAAGADNGLVGRSRGWDISGVRRMVTRHQRITPRSEQETFEKRSIMIQPTLDQGSYKLWGQLPGVDGRVLERALTTRADRFPPNPNQHRSLRHQRFADALISIAQDSLDGTQSEGTTGEPTVSIFLDAHLADTTNGEAGASIDTGPRIGPRTLEQILCHGRVEMLTTTPDGTPITIGPTTRTIPPKLRRFILHRDGGACTADGCQSRYRLQPHHIKPRSQGGTHHPSNLTTLCWFHHHIVIHRNGYRIDPDSPPQRRRFLPPNNRAPPTTSSPLPHRPY